MRRCARSSSAFSTAGLADGEILDGTIAESEAQRRGLWLLRERLPEAERRDGGSVKHDVSVRIGRIAEFIARVEPALAATSRRIGSRSMATSATAICT